MTNGVVNAIGYDEVMREGFIMGISWLELDLAKFGFKAISELDKDLSKFGSLED